MTQGDVTSYREVIVVTLDEKGFNTSLGKVEQQYNQFKQKMAKASELQMKISAVDEATKVMDKVKQTQQALGRQPTRITVQAQDEASAKLKEVQTELKTLGKGATVTIKARDEATSTIKSVQSEAANLARTAATVPLRAGQALAQPVMAEAQGMGMGTGAVGTALMTAGPAAGVVAMGAALGETVKKASDYESTLTKIQNNTTMTNADVDLMRKGMLDLSGDFAQSTDTLSTGMMHVMNLTGDAASSMGILRVATESATSAGGDVSATANVLANVMHEYGADVSTAADQTTRMSDAQNQANHYMGVMHLAAAEANMTLEQFSEQGGQVFAWAANIGVPMEQASAAFATLTKHGFDAAAAGTQVQNLFEHLIKPSKAAADVIADVSQRSGVDLVSDFSAAGVHAKGLTGILADLHQATGNLGLSESQQTQLMMEMIPNIRGGAAAFTLMGQGADDFSSILGDLENKEKTDTVTAQAMARTRETMNFQLQQLGDKAQVAAIQLGEKLLPVALKLMDWFVAVLPELMKTGEQIGQVLTPAMSALGDVFNAMAPHKDMLMAMAGAMAGIMVVIPIITAVAGAFATLGAIVGGLSAASAIGGFPALLGSIVALLGGPVTLIILAVIGTVALLAAAWSNNWGDIQGKTAAVVQFLQDTFQAGLSFITGLWNLIPGDVKDDVAEISAALAADMPGWISGLADATGQMATSLFDWAHSALDAVNTFGLNIINGVRGLLGMGQLETNNLAVAMIQGYLAPIQKAAELIGPALWDAIRTALTFVKQQLGIASPSTLMQEMGTNMMDGLVNGIKSKVGDVTNALGGVVDGIKGAIANAAGQAGNAISGVAGNVSGNVSDWLGQAAAATGVDPSHWLGGLSVIAQHESGGNATAVNNWDTNAAAGNSSRGLMQTTPTTFAAYALPGHGDINNPVDNAIASIRYIQARYKDISNVPGVKAVASGGSYVGYQAGGYIPEPVLGVGAQTGRAYTFAEDHPEYVSRMGNYRGPVATAPGMAFHAPLVHAPITVHAAPGMDEDAVGAAVAAHVRAQEPAMYARLASHWEEAMANIPEDGFR